MQDPYLGHSPVIAFSGRHVAQNQYRNAYQEVPHEPLYQSVTKWQGRVDSWSRYRTCCGRRSARRRPARRVPCTSTWRATRAMPSRPTKAMFDVIVDEAHTRFPAFRPGPDPEAVQKAAAAIKAASRPVIVAEHTRGDLRRARRARAARRENPGAGRRDARRQGDHRRGPSALPRHARHLRPQLREPRRRGGGSRHLRRRQHERPVHRQLEDPEGRHADHPHRPRPDGARPQLHRRDRHTGRRAPRAGGRGGRGFPREARSVARAVAGARGRVAQGDGAGARVREGADVAAAPVQGSDRVPAEGRDPDRGHGLRRALDRDARLSQPPDAELLPRRGLARLVVPGRAGREVRRARTGR